MPCILLQCGYESAHEVSFLDIQLDIKPFGSDTTLGSVVRYCFPINKRIQPLSIHACTAVGRGIECVC